MNNASGRKSNGRLGSLIVSALFVLAGFITLYDTFSYTDRDSKVFPQTVALVLILCASISFVMRFLKSGDDEGIDGDGFKEGSWIRRVLLIATMCLTCLAMPIIGFLPAAVIAFIGGLLAAMHDRWTLKNALLYWSSGAIVMIAFFALFKFVLHVPLP